jgi:endonuclease YncB( thermonuclease family)
MNPNIGRAAAAAVLALGLAACSPAEPDAEPTPAPTTTPEVVGPPTAEPVPYEPDYVEPTEKPLGPWQLAYVLEAIDGDTLLVEVGGVAETVTVAGIDAPELDECFGVESQWEADLVLAGNDVHLVFDEVVGERAADGSLIAEVQAAYGGGDFGRYMVEGGYAADDDGGHGAAEEFARANLLGSWGACTA